MATSTPASPLRRPASASLRPQSKPKLSRRWSLDNINSKEGYVKDLRKQHQAQQVGQRDEAYPFMMTEKRGRVGSLKINMECPRRPLSCSPPPGTGGLFLGCKRSRTMSLEEDSEAAASLVRSSRPKRSSVPTFRFRKGSSSTELATTIVPEDFEFHMEEKAPPASNSAVEVDSELFRKRSSSLPRILPPICDFDEENDDIFDQPNLVTSTTPKNSGKQMDQTSNLIVREMQKFVCKNAKDVSQVLPLPIPANTRQENRLSAGSLTSNKSLDAQHTKILMQNLAKIHAIGYAISERNPSLFQEIATSLETSSLLKRKLDLNNRPALIKILEASTPLIQDHDQTIDTVKTQATELYSLHLCPLFPVITHGNLKNLTFKYNPKAEVTGVKFSSLKHSLVACPLLDIYGAIFQSHQKEVEVHLKTYMNALHNYAANLKVSINLNFDQIMSEFKKYELTGMILTSLMNQKSGHVELGRSCSLGGHDMLMRNLEHRPLFELGNDMGKLAIEKKIPFSHLQEDLEEESN